MNHLEKKECCGKCFRIRPRGEYAIDAPLTYCDNTTCPCHTPTPYSVLREKVMAATRLDMPAIEYIMLHIDEYRESLAKEMDTKAEFASFSPEKYREIAAIIRRT